MSNYGFTNDQGEPIMDGAAYRFEQSLDADYAADRAYDDYYDDYNDYDEDEEDFAGGDYSFLPEDILMESSLFGDC